MIARWMMAETGINMTDVDLDYCYYQSSFELLTKILNRLRRGCVCVLGTMTFVHTIYADTDVHAPFLRNSFLWRRRHERIDNISTCKPLHSIIRRHARM